MQQEFLITIVTPSYNQGQYIEETIQSVLSQKYARIEYIVMDGGSTDATVSILKKYDERLFWVSERDRGQTHAINKGFTMAKGDIIAYLNSDDIYLPDAFKKIAAFFDEHPEIDMVYGEGYHMDASGKIMDRYPTEPFNFDRLRETCFICQPTVFLRRRVFESVGQLDETLHFGMDYEYWIRVTKKHKAAFLPEYLACTRLYADAKTLKNRVKVHAESLRLLKKHFAGPSSKWVFDWGHAVIENHISRETPFKNWLFTAALCGVSSYKFIQQYGRIPIKDLKTMARMFGGTAKEMWRSALS